MVCTINYFLFPCSTCPLNILPWPYFGGSKLTRFFFSFSFSMGDKVCAYECVMRLSIGLPFFAYFASGFYFVFSFVDQLKSIPFDSFWLLKNTSLDFVFSCKFIKKKPYNLWGIGRTVAVFYLAFVIISSHSRRTKCVEMCRNVRCCRIDGLDEAFVMWF